MQKQSFKIAKEIWDSLNKIEFTTEDLVEFNKNLKKPNKDFFKIFFSSPEEISTNYLIKLLNSSVGERILNLYFSENYYANELFFKNCINNYKDFSIIQKYIKINKSYLNDLHFETFYHLNNRKTKENIKFYKQIIFLRKNEQTWNKADEEHYRPLLNSFSYEDILTHIVSFHNYHVKKTKDIKGIKITSRELLSSILKDKIHEDRSIKHVDKKKSSKHKLENDTEIPYNKQNISLKKFLDFRFSKFQNNFNVERVLTEQYEFNYICENSSEIEITEIGNLYEKNLLKHRYADNFYGIKLLKDNKSNFRFTNDIKVKCLINQEYFKFNGINLFIEEKKLDIQKVIYFVQTLSTLLIPNKNYPEEFRSIEAQKFHSIFQEKQKNIYVFNKEELINKCFYFFEWDRNEIIKIIDLITFKIDKCETSNFNDSVFIELENQYYWISALNEDLKFDVLLHRKMSRMKYINHNKQSDEVERKIANLFKENGFISRSGYRYNYKKDNGKISGDIDTIAFRDNTLFIIELKLTHIDEKSLLEFKYEHEKFKIQATNQLKKGIEYIENHFDKVRKDFSIDCELNEINIQSLIVTNVFAVNKSIPNEIPIISLIELFTMLENDIYPHLLNWNASEGALHLVNDNIRDLWKDKKQCTSQDIINWIKEGGPFNYKKLDNINHSEILECYNFI